LCRPAMLGVVAFGAAAIASAAQETVPRRIYTFWHDRSRVPEFVLACLASLAHHNPGWTVRIIHPDDTDVEQPPVGDVDSLTVQQLSDWHRLAALGRSNGGGVWIDASTIALQPLDSWVNMSSPTLQAFAAPFDHAIESWAFAAPRDSPLMAQWLANFRRALRMGVKEYCKALPDWLVGTMRHKGFLPYLAICAAFAEARHQLPDALVTLHPSQEAGGPTQYILSHNGDPNASVAFLFSASESELTGVPFVKLRGAERGCVRALHSYGNSWLASQLRRRLHDSAHLLAGGDAPLQMVHADAATGAHCGFPEKGYNEETLRNMRQRSKTAELRATTAPRKVATSPGHQMVAPGGVE